MGNVQSNPDVLAGSPTDLTRNGMLSVIAKLHLYATAQTIAAIC